MKERLKTYLKARLLPLLLVLGLFPALLPSQACLQLNETLATEALPSLIGALLTANSSTARFLAFTDTAYVLSSTGDGNWTKSAMTGPAKITDVVASGSILLGLDDTTVGVVWKSTDYGVNWTSISVPGVTAKFQKISACGNNVVVSHAPSNVDGYYSSDFGETWSSTITISVISTSIVIDSICNNGRFFVAVDIIPRLLYSDTPTTSSWTSSTGLGSALAGDKDRLAAIGSNFVSLLGGTSTWEYYSLDSGNAFTTGDQFGMSIPSGRGTIGSGNGNFLLMAWVNPNCNLYRSTSGNTGNWSSSSIACSGGTGTIFNSITGNSTGTYIGVGYINGASTPRIIRSTDSGATLVEDDLSAFSGAFTQMLEVIYVQ